jgi:hypothetical protein
MGRESDAFVLKASSASPVGAGNGLVVDLGHYEAGAIFLSITAKTGTFTSYLFTGQVSVDGGTTWSTIGTSTTPATNLPVTVFAAPGPANDITAPSLAWAPVTNYLGPLFRLAWHTAGGTNVTFAAWGVFRR